MTEEPFLLRAWEKNLWPPEAPVRCDEHGRVIGVCEKCGAQFIGKKTDALIQMYRICSQYCEHGRLTDPALMRTMLDELMKTALAAIEEK